MSIQEKKEILIYYLSADSAFHQRRTITGVLILNVVKYLNISVSSPPMADQHDKGVVILSEAKK